jgi:hypothetical protein
MANNAAIVTTGVQGPAGPLPSGAQNLVLATPDGSSGISSLRALVAADLPGGSVAILQSITQVLHGFAVGDAIYFTGSAWAKAKSDANTTLGIGLVSVVPDADHFTVIFAGLISVLSGKTAGQFYFVDPSTAGALTVTEPVSTSQYSNPILLALSTTTGIVLPWRPSAIQSIVTPTVTAVKTTNYSANAWETVLVDPTGGGFAVTLPLAATAGPAAEVTVTNVTVSTNLMTLARSGSDTINAATSATFSGANASVTLFSDGSSGWWVK